MKAILLKKTGYEKYAVKIITRNDKPHEFIGKNGHSDYFYPTTESELKDLYWSNTKKEAIQWYRKWQQKLISDKESEEKNEIIEIEEIN